MNQTNQLIAGFQRGSLPAIHELYATHQSALLYFAERIIHDREHAAEIVIETFIKLINRRNYFDNHTDIKAFLYITARNTCMDFIRYGKNTRQPGEGWPVLPESGINFCDDAILAEANRITWSTIEAMPAIEQQVFRLSFVEGMNPAAAAQHLSIDPQELLVQRKKSMHELQAALSENNLFSTSFLLHFLTVSCRENTVATLVPVPANP